MKFLIGKYDVNSFIDTNYPFKIESIHHQVRKSVLCKPKGRQHWQYMNNRNYFGGNLFVVYVGEGVVPCDD